MKLVAVLLIAIATSCVQPGMYSPLYTCPVIISQSAFDSVLARTQIIQSNNPQGDCQGIGLRYNPMALGCSIPTQTGFTFVVPSDLGERAMNDTIVHEVCHIVRGDSGGHEGWIVNQ